MREIIGAAIALGLFTVPAFADPSSADSWAPSRYTPAANATTAIPVRNGRMAVTILNTGSFGLCLTTSQSATSCTAPYAVIPAGGGLTLNTKGAIYLISSSGTGSAEVFETFN